MRSQPQAAHCIREQQRERVGVFVGVDAKAIIRIAGRIMQQRHVGQGLIKVRQKIGDVDPHDLRDQTQYPLAHIVTSLPKCLGGLSQIHRIAWPKVGTIEVADFTQWIAGCDFGVELVALVLVGLHPFGVG